MRDPSMAGSVDRSASPPARSPTPPADDRASRRRSHRREKSLEVELVGEGRRRRTGVFSPVDPSQPEPAAPPSPPRDDPRRLPRALVTHCFALRIEEARNLPRAPHELFSRLTDVQALFRGAQYYATFDLIPFGMVGARTSLAAGRAPRWHDLFLGPRFTHADGTAKAHGCRVAVMAAHPLLNDVEVGSCEVDLSANCDAWLPLSGGCGQGGELHVCVAMVPSQAGEELHRVLWQGAASPAPAVYREWKEKVAACGLGALPGLDEVDVPIFIAPCTVWTPMMYAVSTNNSEMVKLLKRKGATVNARDQSGNTLMHIAAVHGLKSQIKLVQGMGADPRIVNYLGGKDYREMEKAYLDADELS